jgi:hypothetical protein
MAVMIAAQRPDTDDGSGERALGSVNGWHTRPVGGVVENSAGVGKMAVMLESQRADTGA